MSSIIEFIKLIKNKIYIAFAIFVLIFLGRKYKKMKDLEKNNAVLKVDSKRQVDKIINLSNKVEAIAEINNKNVRVAIAKAKIEKKISEIDNEIASINQRLNDGLIMMNEKYRLIKKCEHDKRILQEELDK